MTRSLTRSVLDAALQAPWINELIGREVEAISVRLKPDTSLLLGYRVRSSETSAGSGLGQVSGQGVGYAPDALGWVRLLWPDSACKAPKLAKKAQGLGLPAPYHLLDQVEGFSFCAPDFMVQHGPLAADPKLLDVFARSGALAALSSEESAVEKPAGEEAPEASSAQGLRVLRYNPARRLVLVRGQRVERLVAGGKPFDLQLHRWLGQFLPVPPVLAAAEPTGLAALEFVGERDLGSGQNPEQAYQAGQLFARLHTASSALPVSLAQTLRQRTDWHGGKQLAVHAQLLAPLDAHLAQRCRDLADRLPELTGETVLIHGDASPDQVLTDSGDFLWLTDFDRAQLGPAAADLGSYWATSSPAVREDFLRGYQDAGGTPLPESQIRAGMAHALALRATAALRAADPAWFTRIAQALDEIEELL